MVREGVPASRSPVSLGTIQSHRAWTRAPSSQDFEPHGAGRLQGLSVAIPRRTLALPFGVPELMGPRG